MRGPHLKASQRTSKQPGGVGTGLPFVLHKASLRWEEILKQDFLQYVQPPDRTVKYHPLQTVSGGEPASYCGDGVWCRSFLPWRHVHTEHTVHSFIQVLSFTQTPTQLLVSSLCLWPYVRGKERSKKERENPRGFLSRVLS